MIAPTRHELNPAGPFHNGKNEPLVFSALYLGLNSQSESVFISWSGTRSKQIANARTWLPRHHPERSGLDVRRAGHAFASTPGIAE
jgi:hypothetical protein